MSINDKSVGFFGELHPQVSGNFDIAIKVYIAELNFDELANQSNLNRYYTPLPKFPSIERDIAVVVSEAISVGQIEEIIINKGGKLIEDLKLFDIYKGSQIEEGYKSVAFRIVYRSSEKTLTDDDIAKVHNRIVNSLSNQIGAILRQ